MLRMLRALTASALIIGVATAVPAAEPAATQADYRAETPLILIRFNQQHLDYKMPLYNAVSAALKARPSAIFDMVSIAPRAADRGEQEHFNEVAKANSQQILMSLNQMGLPAKRLSLASVTGDVETSEVRIYVH